MVTAEGVRALMTGAWLAVAAMHAAAAAAALCLALLRPLDDAAHVGISASPARAVWGTWHLVWCVLAVEAAAAGFSLLSALGSWRLHWLPEAGLYAFFWTLHSLTTAGMACVFLLWLGVLDLSAVVAQAAVTSLVPAVLAATAEALWAAEAWRVRSIGWDRTVVSRAAWAVMFFAWLFAGLSVWTCAERAAAAVAVRGDQKAVPWIAAVFLALTNLLPIVLATARRALDGYYTAEGNDFHVALRTSATGLCRAGFVVALLIGFAQHSRVVY